MQIIFLVYSKKMKNQFKCPINNIEFNNMINSTSQNKAHKYKNILVPQQWKRIKENIIVKIDTF